MAALLAVVSLAASAAAQVPKFQRVLWDGDDEQAMSIEQTMDGGYIIVGNRVSTSDSKIVLRKTDRCGRQQWTWVYESPGSDTAQSVRPTSDGGYIIGGESTAINGAILGLLLLKVDGAGACQWYHLYSGTAGTTFGGTVVREVPNGGYVAVSRWVGGAGTIMGGVLVRTDPLGNLLCGNVYRDTRYGQQSFLSFNDVRANPDGGYTIVGFTNQTEVPPYEVLALRTDQCGNVFWAKTYGPQNEHYAGEGLEVRTAVAGGGYVLTGQHSTGGGTGTFLIAITPAGNPVFHEVYRDFINPRSVRELPGGTFLVAGRQAVNASDASLLTSQVGAFAPGAMIYGSAGFERFEEAIPTGDGGVVAVGVTDSWTPPDGFYFVKTNSAFDSGCFQGPLPPSEQVRDIVIDIQLATSGVEWTNLQMQCQAQFNEETPVCVDCGCAPPPGKLVLWLPFDQATPGDNLVAGNNGTLVNGPTQTNQYVGWGLCFDGIDDYVQVNSYPAINPGFGELSIDAWVKRGANDNGVRVIVDKRREVAGSVRGYSFYLFNGLLCGQLANGLGTQFTNYNSLVAVPADNLWHHVAMTVQRNSTTGGRFYIDGFQVGAAFDTSVRNGNLNSNYPLRVGSRSSSVSAIFLGCIDEVQVFRKALTPDQVRAIYEARVNGKCREVCHLPWDIAVCLNHTSVTVTGQICNYTTTTQTYNYSFSPLPVGPGCNVPGPVSFTPASGTVTVLPGQCVPVTVTIAKPSWFTSAGQVGCYQMQVQNAATGAAFVCHGSLAYHPVWCWNFPFDWTLVPVGVVASLNPGVMNTGSTPDSLSFRIQAIDPDMEPDMSAIRLNGLPPGVPVEGTLALPAGGEAMFPLTAQFVLPDPVAPYTILIEADLDGDGDFEPLASTNFACSIPENVLGDMNCDGVLDFDDINAFVLALSSQDAYEAEYPFCEWMNADCNQDDSVDFDDINAFVALLSAAPNLHVAQPIADNHFLIGGGAPGL